MVKLNNYMGCSISEIGTTGMKNCGRQLNIIHDEYVKGLTKKFNDALRDYLIENLRAKGYNFKDESDFLNFCKENITQNSIDDFVYLYLPDLTLIGKYSTSITINKNDDFTGEFTVLIG